MDICRIRETEPTTWPSLLWPSVPSVINSTIACYETDSCNRICGLGSVLGDASPCANLIFSCQLGLKQRSMLGEQHRKQIIFEAWTLCAVLTYACGRTSWTTGKLSICDNEWTNLLDPWNCSIWWSMLFLESLRRSNIVFALLLDFLRQLIQQHADGLSQGVLNEFNFWDLQMSLDMLKCVRVSMLVSEQWVGEDGWQAVPNEKGACRLFQLKSHAHVRFCERRIGNRIGEKSG